MSAPNPGDPALPPRVEGLSPRLYTDLEEFGRIANPSGTINVPLTNPYEVLPDPAAPWYDTEAPTTNTTDIPHRSTGKAVTMSGETTITVIGNLTADPELRHAPVSRGSGNTEGTPVVNFTIASTPRIYDNQTREWKDGETLFLRASLWRDAAEHAAASLSKGSRVVASGVLKPRSYETKTGEKRTVVELEIEEIGLSLRYGPVSREFTKTADTAPGVVGTDLLETPAPADHQSPRSGDEPAVDAHGYTEDDPWFGKNANPAAWADTPVAAAEPPF